MATRDNRPPNYSLVEGVLNAIAEWVAKYRNVASALQQHGACGPDDAMQIAEDHGVPANQMRELVNQKPGAADLMQKMLVALKVDPQLIAKANPAALRDLQGLCTTCSDKTQCAHELDAGTAGAHFRDYCPNAFALDALFDLNDRPTRH